MLIMFATLILVLASTVFDLKTRRIPNYLTFSMFFFGLAINLIFSGIYGLGDSLLGALVGICLLFVPFALGGIGAGDVKLLGAVGALNGLNFTFFVFVYSAVAGGVIALIILLVKGSLGKVLSNVVTFLKGSFLGLKLTLPSSSIKFPYGSAILIGTVLAYIMR